MQLYLLDLPVVGGADADDDGLRDRFREDCRVDSKCALNEMTFFGSKSSVGRDATTDSFASMFVETDVDCDDDNESTRFGLGSILGGGGVTSFVVDDSSPLGMCDVVSRELPFLLSLLLFFFFFFFFLTFLLLLLLLLNATFPSKTVF